jgi:MoaA/NifB/PqqE/SkfB family radical SAM enzyme
MDLDYKRYLKYGTRVFFKRGASPIYFVFFVSDYCNARCKHCLLAEHEPSKKKNELTIDEIARVSASMDDMLFFTPTGGEPFLRRDLAEIVRIFHRNNHAANVGIPTNGSLTGRVIETTRDMLDTCPGLDLHVDVSIDGIGQEHDEIRQFPGLFDRAVRTYQELRLLEKHYPNFSTCVEITVSAFNQDHLLELYDYLTHTLGVNTVFTLLTRGAPRDPGAKDLDIRKYEELHAALERDNKARILSGYYKMPFSDLLNAKRIVRPHIIAKTVRERRFQIPCYAGSLGGAMFSEGQVLPCELHIDRAIGNVRDFDYDFKKLWYSPRADEIRKYIHDTQCFCTYECFLTINILFNPLVLPRVAKEWAVLKGSELRHLLAGGPAPTVTLTATLDK